MRQLPAWLSDDMKRLYRRYDKWIDQHSTQHELLCVFCHAYCLYVEAAKQLAKEDLTISTSATTKPNPLINIMDTTYAKIERTYRILFKGTEAPEPDFDLGEYEK